MASSSGTSSAGSGSTLLPNSGSEEDLQQLMDQRKRKRMESNRESARRSRMRKQKQLDDLTAQVAQLRKENNQIITSVNITTQHYVNVEAENSILRAQVAELSHRLESLNEIISFMMTTTDNNNNGGYGLNAAVNGHHDHHLQEPYSVFTEFASDGFMNNSWNYLNVNQPMITASADVLQY